MIPRPRPPRFRPTHLLAALAAVAVVALAIRATSPTWAELAVLAVPVAAAAAAWWRRRRVLQSLARLTADADRLASRDVEHRVAAPSDPRVAPLARAVERLAAGRRGEIEALEGERNRFRSILASMSEGLLVTDAEGRIERVNPAFARLFELPERRVEGRSPLELTRLPALARLIETTLASGGSHGEQIELDGLRDRRTLDLAASRLDDDRGGVVVGARDVGDLMRLSEMRRDLVANVSHELKTPLASIRGLAETLAGGAIDDPPTARRFIDRMVRQCDRLEALLEDLLVLSRLESPAAVAGRGAVDLEALVRRAVELVSGLAEEREVEIAIAADALPTLEGESEALDRMVTNLLENAVKYNRAGGRVDVRLQRRDDTVVLEVEDTGIGIPREALDRVFERFYRVDRGRGRHEGGTGLGLAIVKHAAKIHGGRVEATSREGRGSTFRVVLPLERRVDGVGRPG